MCSLDVPLSHHGAGALTVPYPSSAPVRCTTWKRQPRTDQLGVEVEELLAVVGVHHRQDRARHAADPPATASGVAGRVVVVARCSSEAPRRRSTWGSRGCRCTRVRRAEAPLVRRGASRPEQRHFQREPDRAAERVQLRQRDVVDGAEQVGVARGADHEVRPPTRRVVVAMRQQKTEVPSGAATVHRSAQTGALDGEDGRTAPLLGGQRSLGRRAPRPAP